MRCVHNEIYKKCSIKIYMTTQSYFAKTKLPNERKHNYISDYQHDFKKDAIVAAKEEIDGYMEV